MFAAEMANDCGIGYWEPNSRVVHAVSTRGPTGPFERAEVVVSPFAHEPNAVRAPDGSWVIYFTMRHPPGELYNCTGGMPRARPHYRGGGDSGAQERAPESRHTYMTHSPSPHGPWATPVLVLKANTSIWDKHKALIDTNLAVVINEDGSVLGLWRLCENEPKGTICETQCCTFLHSLRASDWRDPRTYLPDSSARIFPQNKPFGAEDPMLWAQTHHPRGGPSQPRMVVHAIVHDEQGDSRETAIGRHAFSDDGGLTWTYAQEDAYNGTVGWEGGGGVTLWRRERPHMVVDSAGVPIAVSNGVQESRDDDRSYTLVQPLVGS